MSWKLPLRMFRRLPPTSRLGVAALRRLGAIDVDVEGGVVVGLLDAEVDEAGNLAQLGEYFVGDLAIACDVSALESGCRWARASRS